MITAEQLGTIGEVASTVACEKGGGTFLHVFSTDGAVAEWTYEQLLEKAAQWADYYRVRGFRPGDHIVVCAPHSIDLYTTYIGAIMAGCVPAMFAFPSAKHSIDVFGRTIQELLSNANPRLIVLGEELLQQIAPLLTAEQRRLIVSTAIAQSFGSAKIEWTARNVDDIAFLQYSSGTTGLKKGVAITHRALLWQIQTYSAAIGLKDGDRIISWLPLYHDMGLICCLFLPLLTGTPLVSMSAFDWVKRPALLLEAITRYRGTLCWLPNFAYSFLAQNVRPEPCYDLSSLRGLVNCSETVMSESHEQFLKAFQVVGFRQEMLAASYAMAEATFAISSGGFHLPLACDVVSSEQLARFGRAVPISPTSPEAKKVVSSGVVLPQTNVTIMDADGQPAPDRVVGEIVVCSPSLMTEYHRNCQATATALKEGWFYTGDLGYKVGDNLFVVGRKKDVIIVAGKNLYPHDIEAAVGAIPGVIPGRVAAFGLTDISHGTERLIVVVESEVRESDARQELQNRVSAAVASRMDVVPGDVRVVDPRWLEKSTSGKIARSAARVKYEHEFASIRESDAGATIPCVGAVYSTLDEASRRAAIINCVTVALQQRGGRLECISTDTKLITSGLVDSLTLVAVIVNLERLVGRTIPASLLGIGYFDSIVSIDSMLTQLVATPDGSPQRGTDEQVRQIDDRDKAAQAFEQQGADIDLLVLGSSRSQCLSPYVMKRYGFVAFNFWLDSARVEDWYCALRFVLQRNRRKLKAVILAIDVESFSNSAPVEMRLLQSVSLSPYLEGADRPETGGGVPQGQGRFAQLLRQYRLGQAEPWAVGSTGQRLRTDRYCGPMGEYQEERGPSAIADPEDRHVMYCLRMKDYTALSDARREYFEKLVRICESEGIALVTSTSQLHSSLHVFLSEQTSYGARLDDVRALLTGYKGRNVSYFHAPTVSAYRGYDGDFFDGAHIDRANSDLWLHRLMNRVLGQLAAPNCGVECPRGEAVLSIIASAECEHSATDAASDLVKRGIVQNAQVIVVGAAEPHAAAHMSATVNVLRIGEETCRDDLMRGCAHATGDYVCFFTPETGPSRDRLSRQIALLDHNPDLSAVYCDYDVDEDERLISNSYAAHRLNGAIVPALVAGLRIPPAVMMMRTGKHFEVFAAVESFDEGCLRFAAEGAQFFFDDTISVRLPVHATRRPSAGTMNDDLSLALGPAMPCGVIEALVALRAESARLRLAMRRIIAVDRQLIPTAGVDARGKRHELLYMIDSAKMVVGRMQQRAVWKVKLENEHCVALMLQPPAAISFRIPTGVAGRFSVSVALHPDVWNKRPSMGCAFQARIDGRVGFMIALDPAKFVTDRKWTFAAIDVPQNPQNEHVITLETQGVDGTDFRWALWRKPCFEECLKAEQ